MLTQIVIHCLRVTFGKEKLLLLFPLYLKCNSFKVIHQIIHRCFIKDLPYLLIKISFYEIDVLL